MQTIKSVDWNVACKVFSFFFLWSSIMNFNFLIPKFKNVSLLRVFTSFFYEVPSWPLTFWSLKSIGFSSLDNKTAFEFSNQPTKMWYVECLPLTMNLSPVVNLNFDTECNWFLSWLMPKVHYVYVYHISWPKMWPV